MHPRDLLHWLKPALPRLAAGVGLALCALSGVATAAPTVSQMPLSIAAKVPSNLLLVPSLEFPTMITAANSGTTYSGSTEYTGNFDADKCYQYYYVAVETATDVRHFYPTGLTSATHTCSPVAWSGNWLNWATAQAIEPFRKVLTGGHRVVDTTTTTILEKAWADGNDTSGTFFPNRTVGTGANAVTPTGWTSITSGVRTLGNKMRFTSTAGSTLLSAVPVPYVPTSSTNPVPIGGFLAGAVYEVTVRVKVCATGFTGSLEPDCKQYGSNYKPEGLIQKYEQKLRYSAFGYLNDSAITRDGGVLRAQQKFVGPQKLDPSTNTWVTNSAREWDANGIFVTNPDSSSAANSGVINYINKGGQTTGANHKTYDPVSELYYTAIRYLKNQGNVSAYSALPADPAAADIVSDRFPVITSWDDPIQYSCQNNSILGIGDTNTWYDKNLPGSTASTDEPTMPSEVAADNTVNVMTATAKVAELEGITIGTPFNASRNSSAFIAGLAYDSHTKDLRSDIAEIQTVSTYWMDVRESDVVAAPALNPFWLAAKYGGFTVPENYQPYTTTTALAQSLWSEGDLVAGTTHTRPRNFYTAGDGASTNTMAQGLAHAFARIAAEEKGSSSSLAANSTRLDTETRVYQAQFHSGVWWGDLSSYRVDGSDLASAPEWSAADKLATRTYTTRTIKTYNPEGSNAARKYPDFTYAALSSASATTQLALLGTNATEQTMIINYLRGDRTNETSQADGTLRTRTYVLGDIVNSTPTYVGKPNQNLYDSATFTGASGFGEWANSDAIRLRTPMIYVGANDGMLHGFNADTGAEVYAFVPRAVYANLKAYTDPSYTHQYFVDGDVTVADVYDGGWKTILVGTLGRGGKSVFALDVTDPTNITFLWEKGVADIPALGNNIGRPVIAQVANGDWRVLIGNGPNSTAGTAKLIMIDINDGDPHVVSTDTSVDNGLTAVLARDSGSSIDYFSDTAYAGDIKGNLWKFTNLSASTPTVTKLFVAKDPSNVVQPITAAPVVAKNPLDGSIWILFGTGQYLSETDLATTQVQSWYGIRDSGTLVARADMVQRQVLTTTTEGLYDVRTISTGTAADLVGKPGWYLDLPASGERMVVPNRIQGEVVIGTSRIPSSTDICKPGGKGFVMAIDPFTGARLPNSYFDVNGDGLIDENDEVTSDSVAASGIGFDSGVNNPIFADGVMLVSKDDGSSQGVQVAGKSSTSRRLGWRELLN